MQVGPKKPVISRGLPNSTDFAVRFPVTQFIRPFDSIYKDCTGATLCISTAFFDWKVMIRLMQSNLLVEKIRHEFPDSPGPPMKGLLILSGIKMQKMARRFFIVFAQ